MTRGAHVRLKVVVTDSTPAAAAFSLNMLVGTDAGDAYTLAEYEKMFGNAGFTKTTLHPVTGMPQQVLISGKPE